MIYILISNFLIAGLFVGYIIWREQKTDATIKELTAMARARSADEFSAWKDSLLAPAPTPEKPAEEEEIDINDLSFEEIQSIKRP